jgi:hypothetical protein
MKKKKEVPEYWNRPVYKGFKLSDVVHRVGALEVLKYPSRVHNTYYYPDGKVTKV